MTAAEVVDLDDAALRAWALPSLTREGDKEARGRVLIIAGSAEIPGAAVLAATASLRAGAGKVAIATCASIAQSVAFAVPESRVIALKETDDGTIAASEVERLADTAKNVAAVLIGPGLPYSAGTRELAAAAMATFEHSSVLLDAGAMGVVREVKRFSNPPVLTPHAGEMASLSGEDKEDVVDSALDMATAAARRWNAIVALKGAVTHIAAPDGNVWRNCAGNPGLATSGSGDVLAGIIVGLLARGAALEQAAAWGVGLHARAGDRLAQRIGPFGYLARELAAEVPPLMAMLAA